MTMTYLKSMKKLFTLCLFMLFLMGNLAQAEKQDKVVLHLNNPLKMTMLVNNVKNLRKMLSKDTKIAIIVNGPAVARFSNTFSSRKQLDEILQQKATVNICSFALKNKNIKKEQLFEGVTYLEDGGVAKLVELQQKGYAYIKP